MVNLGQLILSGPLVVKQPGGGSQYQAEKERKIEEVRCMLFASNLTPQALERKYGASYATVKKWLDILVQRNMAVTWTIGRQRWYGASEALRKSRTIRGGKGQ